MKASLKTIALLALSSGLASAATTVVSAYYDTSFRTSTGTLLGTTFTAKIGVTSAAFTNESTFSTINAGWTNVATPGIAFQSSAGGFPGYFTGTFSYSNAVHGLQGQQIVLWVTDGANQNFVANLGQVFANDLAAPFNSNTFDITSITRATMTVRLGSYAAGTDGFGGTGGNFILNNAVPEPSAALLGAIGALGLLRRRRI